MARLLLKHGRGDLARSLGPGLELPASRPEDLGEEGHVPEGGEGRSPPDTGTYTDGGSRKKSR